MHRSYFHRAPLAVFASALLVFGACSDAPRGDAGSAALPAVSAAPLTESEAATLSSAGVGVVHHIVTARTQIEGGRVENAWNELVQARFLLEDLLKESPAVRVKSRIWHVRERLPTEDTQALIDELAPIYDDLDRVEAPVAPAAVWVRLGAAMASLEDGESSAAIDYLDAAEEAVQLMVAAVATRKSVTAIN